MTVEQTDRESVAKRLLRSSVDHSHEPAIDIGWDAEPVDGLYEVSPGAVLAPRHGPVGRAHRAAAGDAVDPRVLQ